jgi:hypothetical protein
MKTSGRHPSDLRRRIAVWTNTLYVLLSFLSGKSINQHYGLVVVLLCIEYSLSPGRWQGRLLGDIRPTSVYSQQPLPPLQGLEATNKRPEE